MKQGFSIEEAEEKIKLLCDNTSLDAYIRRFGIEVGNEKYKEMCDKRKKEYTLNFYIEKYGEIEGTECWLKKFENRKPDSIMATKFFNSIYDKLPQDIKNLNIYYKPHTKKEFGRMGANGKYYFYDFVIPKLLYCIEFNGAFWHGNPKKYKSGDFIFFRNKQILVDDIWENDKIKLCVLENLGFEVKIIWSYDKKIYNNLINECVDDIINRYNIYKEKENEET